MLISCLCLLAMFVCWLFGHILGYLIYLVILFTGHIINFWAFYLSILTLVLMIHWIGIKQLTVILILILVIAIILLLSLFLTWQLRKH